MQEQDEESGPTDPHDLILRGPRVIDPSQNLDRVTDVRFTGGKVVAIGDPLSAGPGTGGESLMFHRDALGRHCGLARQSMAPGSSPG